MLRFKVQLMKDIKKTSRQYCCQVLYIVNVLMLATYGIQYFTDSTPQLLVPLLVSYGFYIVTALFFILVWKKVAKSNPEMLTSVYMATSGFRMLLALATLTTVYLVVGRDKMLPYVIVFMVFYLVAIGHHSYFFARFNNQH